MLSFIPHIIFSLIISVYRDKNLKLEQYFKQRSHFASLKLTTLPRIFTIKGLAANGHSFTVKRDF